MFKIKALAISKIGELYRANEGHFGWVTISASFEREGKQFFPHLEMSVGINYTPDMTIAQIHDAALTEAQAMLAEAGRLFSERNPAQLRELAAELQDREELQ